MGLEAQLSYPELRNQKEGHGAGPKKPMDFESYKI